MTNRSVDGNLETIKQLQSNPAKGSNSLIMSFKTFESSPNYARRAGAAGGGAVPGTSSFGGTV